jgi:hypothetical protein
MSTGVKTHRITDPNDDTRFVDVDPYVVECVPRCIGAYDQPATSLRSPNTNVSSVTDNNTGVITVNYTNAFTTAEGPVVVSAVRNEGSSNDGVGTLDTSSSTSEHKQRSIVDDNFYDSNGHTWMRSGMLA